MGEFIGMIVVLVTGITLIWAGIFYLTKKNYQNQDEGLEFLMKITPLPRSINYWLVKTLFIVSGLLAFLASIYGFVTY
ncbi:hypothetical protein ACQKGI_22055 [Peribacillus muralis]|uniref:hypothetical protein n=1 Tax=Peribacillus muralis TaxID=264697 RepID=UPI00380C9931